MIREQSAIGPEPVGLYQDYRTEPIQAIAIPERPHVRKAQKFLLKGDHHSKN
jgi:hypothetical protein